MSQIAERRLGFEGHVDQVTASLRGMIPDRNVFPMYHDHFVAVISAISDDFGKNGEKFTGKELMSAQSDYLLPGEIVMEVEVAGDLLHLRRIGVVVRSSTYRNWRVSEAGRRALNTVIGELDGGDGND